MHQGVRNSYTGFENAIMTFFMTYGLNLPQVARNDQTVFHFSGRVWAQDYSLLASFPGLHAQLLLLAVRKAGEGLDGLIT